MTQQHDLVAALMEYTAQGRVLTSEERWLLACGLLGITEASKREVSWHFRRNEALFLAEMFALWPTGTAFLATLQAFATAAPEQVLDVLDQLVTGGGRLRYMVDEARALGPKSLNAQIMLGAQARVMAFYLQRI